MYYIALSIELTTRFYCVHFHIGRTNNQEATTNNILQNGNYF